MRSKITKNKLHSTISDQRSQPPPSRHLDPKDSQVLLRLRRSVCSVSTLSHLPSSPTIYAFRSWQHRARLGSHIKCATFPWRARRLRGSGWGVTRRSQKKDLCVRKLSDDQIQAVRERLASWCKCLRFSASATVCVGVTVVFGCVVRVLCLRSCCVCVLALFSSCFFVSLIASGLLKQVWIGETHWASGRTQQKECMGLMRLVRACKWLSGWRMRSKWERGRRIGVKTMEWQDCKKRTTGSAWKKIRNDMLNAPQHIGKTRNKYIYIYIYMYYLYLSKFFEQFTITSHCCEFIGENTKLRGQLRVMLSVCDEAFNKKTHLVLKEN